ncbi:MAG TPA: aspartate/glutamate racemase family protein [Deltaproteobacteria bacterium]|nr:aspartate/glutamate racemase family protein [Deltaproteobacteria bacterium]
MYSYTNNFKDEDVYINEGRVMGGVAIGIILFGQTGYAFPPGSVENATTFNFPVHFKAIEAASVGSVVSSRLDPVVLEQLIQTGNEMVQQGCRAIIGACGYFANYLPDVVKVMDVPCFFSSLMQVPLILRSMTPGKKVGVICANGSVLTSAPVLKNCGVDDPSSVVIAGAEILPEMQKILTGVSHYNPVKLEQGIVEIAKQMVSENHDIGSLLLECTLFPTHARAVQDAVRLPVFDFSTLINWVYSAVVRQSFSGYM